MTLRKVFICLIFAVSMTSMGFDRPHYFWEEPYEPRLELIGDDYTLRWTPSSDDPILERNGRSYELAMSADSFILGCVDDYLYFGRKLWNEDGGSGLRIRRMHVDDADLGFFVDMYELVCPLSYADFALSPDGQLLAVAAGGDEKKVEVLVYRLGRECEIVQRRVFPVETGQIRVSVHLLEWSDDGESLYMNFHPHSPASDEFLDLQPLLRWDIEEDEVTEVLPKVGWVLPVAGRNDRTVVLAEEIVIDNATWTMPWGSSPGQPPYQLTRWVELDLATGEVAPAFEISLSNAVEIPDEPERFRPERLFDGDPETGWRGMGEWVDVDLGRPLPLDGFLVIGGYAESGETTPEDTVTWDTWFQLEPHESPYEIRGNTEWVPVGEVVESVVLTSFPNNPDRAEQAATAELIPRFAFWPVP